MEGGSLSFLDHVHAIDSFDYLFELQNYGGLEAAHLIEKTVHLYMGGDYREKFFSLLPDLLLFAG